MKQIIGQVLQEKLDKAAYSSDRAAVLTKEISDAVKAQLKGGRGGGLPPISCLVAY